MGHTIEAVLFDYGGVMTELPGPGMAALAESAGADPAQFASFFREAYHPDGGGDGPFQKLERGEMTLQELDDWGRAEGTRRGWTLSLAGLIEVVSGMPIRPKMMGYVSELRQRGFRTALITNNAREFSDIWRSKLQADDLFDVVVVSCDVGVRKPDPAIYELALERLGSVPPERAVFVDDMEGNLSGARDIGMHTVLVDDDTEAAIDRLETMLSLG
jgi:putative hydrolase of the HAD superfamily